MENAAPQVKTNTEQVTQIDCETEENTQEVPCILDEVRIEELAIDGICGVY